MHYLSLYLISKMDKFVWTITGQTFASKHNISCKSSNLIYLITCKQCHKQYVGQTKNSIAQRFYSHLHNICQQKQTDGVGLHISRKDHKGCITLQMFYVLQLVRYILSTLYGKTVAVQFITVTCNGLVLNVLCLLSVNTFHDN